MKLPLSTLKSVNGSNPGFAWNSMMSSAVIVTSGSDQRPPMIPTLPSAVWNTCPSQAASMRPTTSLGASSRL